MFAHLYLLLNVSFLNGQNLFVFDLHDERKTNKQFDISQLAISNESGDSLENVASKNDV